MKRIVPSAARWLASPADRAPVRPLLVIAVAALALLGLERGFDHWRARGLVGPGAEWIWLGDPDDSATEPSRRPPDDPRAARPTAFFAAADFELGKDDRDALRSGESQAHLDIAADESYVAYVNGQWVGGNSFHPDASLDRYDVGRWLRAGENRLLIELRSQREVGGLLSSLRLRDPAGERTLLASDGGWKLFRRYHRQLFRLGSWPEGAEAPRVWSPPPTGRWRPEPASSERPTPYTEDHHAPAGPPRVAPRKTRKLWGKDWIDLGQRRRRLPALGPKVLFDWGREVSGYLFFDLPSQDHPPALAWYGDRPPDPFERSPDEVLIFTPGLDQWRAIHPRTFRHVLLIGVAPKRRIEVRRLVPELVESLAPPPPIDGVFGIEPANRYTPAEELVWERLRDEIAQERGQNESPSP